MTSREKVLSVYPDAHAWSEHPHEWFISSVNEDTDYGGGYTESQAWDDAASKLPPGSPAGETASACNCSRKGSKDLFRRPCPIHAKSVPEPVPTEGAGEGYARCLFEVWQNEFKANFEKEHGRPMTNLELWISGTSYNGGKNRPDLQPKVARSAAPIAPAAEELIQENERLKAYLNTPETDDFFAGIEAEAAHQRYRWPTENDAGKTPADWFWLVGYLAGKCLASHIAGNTEKALHHTISTAAALANWHRAIKGAGNMRPGIDTPVETRAESYRKGAKNA